MRRILYKLGEEFNQEIIELCELYKTNWLTRFNDKLNSKEN
jgi:hypothetical protein